MSVLSAQIDALEMIEPLEISGSVGALRGLTLLVDELPLPIGSFVKVHSDEGVKLGEVVGVDGDRAIVMMLGHTAGIRAGARVVGDRSAAMVPVGRRLLGRVVDALARPLDGKAAPVDLVGAPLLPAPISPLKRRAITEALPTGVRAIDLMTTVGRGQRMGIFAGPGVGKSTLIGSIAKHTAADVSVVALIGERGREVRDFIERSLGEKGLERSVVVVATSDDSPLLRIRAALAAASIAEHFRDQGADVMLLMDSITRFAQAQRQVGLSVGEPPATKGYTPSVFALMPLLLERAGAVEGKGSVTGFYAILVEGDDMSEPIADAARGILDGHVILSRKLAQHGQYPAIDVLDSVSRVQGDVTDRQHQAARMQVQRMLAAHREVEDLVQIGAYARGSNAMADVAIAMKQKLDGLLRQGSDEAEPFDDAKRKLLSLAVESGAMLQQVQRAQASAAPGNASGGRAR